MYGYLYFLISTGCNWQAKLKTNVFYSEKNESHWLQVSTSKLLGDYSDNIKMPNESFDQNVQVKNEKKVISTIEFCIFELAYNLGHILEQCFSTDKNQT